MIKLVVLTGGLGQLGRQFMSTLLQNGAKVAVFDLPTDAHSFLDSFSEFKNSLLYYVNITRKRKILHYIKGGQGDMIAASLSRSFSNQRPVLRSLGLNKIPVCGQNNEVLKYHGLDADSFVDSIISSLQ